MSDSLERENLETWLRRPSIFIANAWYLLAAAGLFALNWLSILLGSLFPGIERLLSAMISPIYNLCLLAFPVAMYASTRPGITQALRLKRPRWYECAEALALALPAVMLCDCLGSWWYLLLEAIGGHLTPPQTVYAAGWPGWFSLFLSQAFLPGICEELLLHGGVLGAWERRGTLHGLCVSSALFCALHGSIQGLPVQLFMGFALGVLIIRSDSLIPGMICHIAFNAISLLLSAKSGAQAVAYADFAGWIAQNGGLSLLLFRTLVSAFVFGALLMMYMSHRRAGQPFDKVRPGEREIMEWDELFLLLAALLTVAVRYGADLLSIGGLR